MSRTKLPEQEISKNEVKFFLTDAQLDEYDEFLKPFAGKRGPYAKVILFKHIREQKQQATPQAANQ